MLTENGPRNLFLEPKIALERQIVACSALADSPLRQDQDLLGANGFFEVLPDLIRRKDADSIRYITEILGTKAGNISIDDLYIEDAKVIQRDLSMAVTASTLVIRKPDEIPDANEIVPIAAEQLVKLSSILGIPARTTDGNWTGMNPRFFTDTRIDVAGEDVRAEAIIKICVGKNWEKQEETVANLMEVSKTDVNDISFPFLIRKSTENFSQMVSSLSVLSSNLTQKEAGRKYFVLEFLPMTMQYKINGEVLIHSGSQYSPNHFLDKILGITDGTNEEHLSYREQNLKTASSEHKAKFSEVLENVEIHGTLLDRVIANQEASESLGGIYELVKRIAQFRTLHVAAIDKSAGLRYNNESSGGQISMAHDLRDRTIVLRNRLGELVKERAA